MYGRGYQSPGIGFGPPVTPPVVKQLLIANGVVFLVQMLIQANGINPIILFGVVPGLVWQQGWLWQPFTYMWLHGGPGHLLMNLFVLWMFGSQLAMAWGAKRFLRFYLICGIGAGAIIATYPYLLMAFGLSSPIGIPTVGASGAIYGVLLAYSFTWPDRTIMLLFPPVAFRAIWLIPGLFVMSLIFPTGNISHLGHLGGVVVAWLYLHRTGDAQARNLFSIQALKYRWRRHRMRQKLRAVQYEEFERRRNDDDRRIH